MRDAGHQRTQGRHFFGPHQLALRRGELGERAGQLLRALLHPVLQRGVELQDVFLVAVFGGDVVKGHDEHPLTAQHHHAARQLAQHLGPRHAVQHPGAVARQLAALAQDAVALLALGRVFPDAGARTVGADGHVALQAEHPHPGAVHVHGLGVMALHARYRHGHRRGIKNGLELGLANAQRLLRALTLGQLQLQGQGLLLTLGHERSQVGTHGVQRMGQLAHFVLALGRQGQRQFAARQPQGVAAQFQQGFEHTAVEQRPDHQKGQCHLQHQGQRKTQQVLAHLSLDALGRHLHREPADTGAVVDDVALVAQRGAGRQGLVVFAHKYVLELVGHGHAHHIGVAHHRVHQLAGHTAVQVPHRHRHAAREHLGILPHGRLYTQGHLGLELGGDLKIGQKQRRQQNAQRHPQHQRLAQGQDGETRCKTG